MSNHDQKMSNQKKLFGVMLALILDIGTGLVLTHIVISMLHVNQTWGWLVWYYGLGVFFSLLPDFDQFIPLGIELATGKTFDSSHKSWPTHYPIVMILPAGLVYTIHNATAGMVVFVVMAFLYLLLHEDEYFIARARGMENLPILANWATVMTPTTIVLLSLFAERSTGILAFLAQPFAQDRLIWFMLILCLVMHFVHDSWQSQENGPGVRWFAPFYKRYFQFFSRHAAGEKRHLILMVSQERVERTFKETLEEWLNSIFFKLISTKYGFRRPTWENMLGITVFLVGISLFLRDVIAAI